MAFLFSSMGNKQNRGQVTTVDSSIISKLSEVGYNLNGTNLTIDQVRAVAQPAQVQLVQGAYVPVYQTSNGTMYVIDERSNIYVVTKAPTEVGGGTLGVGGTNVRPPIVTDPGPINTGGGGNVRPPIGGGGGGGNTNTPLPPTNGGLLGSGKVFTRFEVGDIIPNQESTVTRAMWSNNVGNLITHYTSSAQTATQKRYYYEIFNSASSAGTCVAEAQYSVAYGHKQGSGSADEGGQVNDTPSKAIYGQYRLLCLEPNEERFIIDGVATDHIYVINFNRSRFRERVDEGNLEINLAHLSGSYHLGLGKTVNEHTGSNVLVNSEGKYTRLVDDSKIASATITSAGEVFNIVSGSIEDGVYNSSSPVYFGKLYPRLGVAVLDANKLDTYVDTLTVTGSEIPGDNSFKLYTAISASAAMYTDASGDILGFAARSSEKVKSMHFFVRVKNGEYNFSNNPTFTTGSVGDLAQPTFINDPQVYITTVGLYNSRKELMAVAKMSKPLLKNFTREALIKVKLDF
jgi:hypothetical protein